MGGVYAGGMGDAEAGRLVAAPAASLRPSAERNPLIREKPRMNGAPGDCNPPKYVSSLSYLLLPDVSLPVTVTSRS